MRSFLVWLSLAFVAMLGISYFLHTRYFAVNGGPAYRFDLLVVGNVLLALLSLAGYLMIAKAVKDKNPNALMRAKTGGMMLKFLVTIGAMLAYIFAFNRIVHKPSIFTFLGMYLVYAIIEALCLSKTARTTPS